MKTLKVICSDIFHPVIKEVDTLFDQTDIIMEISKEIDKLHDQKIKEILTINYVLQECSDKINSN